MKWVKTRNTNVLYQSFNAQIPQDMLVGGAPSLDSFSDACKTGPEVARLGVTWPGVGADLKYHC